MKADVVFPETLQEFLQWVKDSTELFWRNLPGDSLLHGAKWLPLCEEEINRLEMKYAIRFGEEHRMFLGILHTIDKKDPSYVNVSETKTNGEPSFFYNWITEDEWITDKLAWPYQTILRDVLGPNGFWLSQWGDRPDTDEDKTRIFSAWYNAGPGLLPLTAHTFLTDHDSPSLKPVLSVFGSDTIVVAWSLRHYLMRTFAQELDLLEMIYDEEDQSYYGEIKKGIQELDVLEKIRLSDADMPYWKDVITYWDSQWTGLRTGQ